MLQCFNFSILCAFKGLFVLVEQLIFAAGFNRVYSLDGGQWQTILKYLPYYSHTRQSFKMYSAVLFSQEWLLESGILLQMIGSVSPDFFFSPCIVEVFWPQTQIIINLDAIVHTSCLIIIIVIIFAVVAMGVHPFFMLIIFRFASLFFGFFGEDRTCSIDF